MPTLRVPGNFLWHGGQALGSRALRVASHIWAASQPNTWRERMEIVAMERFTGLKSAAAEELPARGRSWISFTSRTRPGMLSMNAAGTSGKNVTSGAGVPTALTEIVTLGRTLKRQSRDILAYFDHPHTTGGPIEAINGHLEHLRGSALELAKPHQLHHPSTPRNRRIQTPTTPPTMKSPFSC